MATPTIVQHVAVSNMQGDMGSHTPLTIQLLWPSQAGNFLMLHLYTNNTAGMDVSSVTDDKSQTWTRTSGTTTNSQLNQFIYTFKNTVSGVRTVTINFTNPSGFCSYTLSEWFNVDQTTPIGAGKAISTEVTTGSTTWATGAFGTNPTAGDAIYQTGQAGAFPYNDQTGFTAGSNGGTYVLEAAEMCGGLVAQVCTNATGGSTNPTLTAGTSSVYNTMAVALTSASAGADNPNGFRVKRAMMMSLSPETTATPKYQFPCEGNLQVLCSSAGNASTCTLSSVTSSSASYAHINNSPLTGTFVGSFAMMYAKGFSPSRTNNGTITLTSVPDISTKGVVVWFLDVIGADPTSPLDTSTVTSAGTGTVGSNTGNQTVAGNLAPFTLQPSGGTELAINYLDHDSGSDTGVTGSTYNFVEPYNGQNGGAGETWTMDSGLALALISANATVTYTRSATAAGQWGSLGALFKAPAGGFAPDEDYWRIPQCPALEPMVTVFG
jgi:hypothetical protein